MSKIKIFNDPIYGLVSFPFPFIYELIDHPYFQRLRRIQQLGMSSIVYPGATHSRFHHALGALHLCDRLIQTLQKKGIQISEEEYESTLAATLLHDIGHGPFSHALEYEIIPVHHEELTKAIMHRLNKVFDGRLDMAIDIFQDDYHKPFLHQMISGQIDVDRMDYLNRDSFYTGVAEGIIGYDRIIKMMNVRDNQLVVEEKGILSIEKFLLSRYFMYKQVYLHSAALTADHMLKNFFKKYKESVIEEPKTHGRVLSRLIQQGETLEKNEIISLFLQIDDSDVISLLKECSDHEEPVLAFLSTSILHRRLFGIEIQYKPFEEEHLAELKNNVLAQSNLANNEAIRLISLGTERTQLYNDEKLIMILRKRDNKVVTFNSMSRLNLYQTKEEIHFATFPR